MAIQDYRKTKAELVEELETLRRHLAAPAAERAAREDDDRYRLLLKNLPDAVRISCGGMVVYANDACVRLFGATRAEELIGRNVDDFIVPDDRERIAAHRRMILATGVAPMEEQRRLRLDGSEVAVEVFGIRVAWQGRPAVLNVIRDVTERHEALRALRESEARFHALAENIPGATFQLERDAQDRLGFSFVSQGLEALFGVTAEAAMRRPIALFRTIEQSDRARLHALFRTASDDGDPIETELRTRAPRDGAPRVVQLIARPRRRDDGTAVWEGLFLDATQRHEALEALKRARDAAELADRTKSAFLANMSHEIRNPLNAILGFAEVIEMEMFGPTGAAQYREYAADIRESGRHLLAIINDVLDISKVEAGKLEIGDEQLDVRELIDSSLSVLKRRAQAGEIKLAVRVGRSLPRLRGDERRIRQVLLNLLTNASKFTPDGGEVRVSASVDAGHRLRIRVSDTGIGMAPAEIDRALTPFVQIGPPGTRAANGTGLGLPLAKSLVERHDGRFKIDSRPGKGTTVTVSFPPVRLVA